MSEHSREQKEAYLREELRWRAILYTICAAAPLIPTLVLILRYDQTQAGLVAPMFLLVGLFCGLAAWNFERSRRSSSVDRLIGRTNERHEFSRRKVLRRVASYFALCAAVMLAASLALILRYDQTQIGLVAPMFFVSGFFWSVACGSFDASRGQE